MVRRRSFAGVGLVLVILIVLLVSGCLKSQAHEALKEYNRDVSQLAQESNEQVSTPLFSTLAGASGKSALNVEVQVDQLHLQAQSIAAKAKALSVPGAMVEAQRELLLTMNLRAEGLGKVATLLPAALGGQGRAATQAGTNIAGAMELFLASDVVYSQRVAPLIQQTLADNGISGLSTTATRFLPNLGWLEASTVMSRITGQSTTAATTLSGHHGSALKGVSVGTNALEVEPSVNHISSGASPTFVATVEDAGEFIEPNVKVAVTVTVQGKAHKATGTIERTEPGKSTKVEVPVTGVPLGEPAKIEVKVEPVPGETNHEDTEDTFLAIFS